MLILAIYLSKNKMFEMSKSEKERYIETAKQVVVANNPQEKCKQLWVARWQLIIWMNYCKESDIYPTWFELLTHYIGEAKKKKKEIMVNRLVQRKEKQHEEYHRTNVILWYQQVQREWFIDTILTIAKEFMFHEDKKNKLWHMETFSIFKSEFPEIYENITKSLPMKSTEHY